MGESKGSRDYYVRLQWLANLSSTAADENYRTTSKVERVKEYLEVENVPDLTEEEVRAITEAGYNLHQRFFVSVAQLRTLHPDLYTSRPEIWTIFHDAELRRRPLHPILDPFLSTKLENYVPRCRGNRCTGTSLKRIYIKPRIIVDMESPDAVVSRQV
jgi:hypothetical protein